MIQEVQCGDCTMRTIVLPMSRAGMTVRQRLAVSLNSWYFVTSSEGVTIVGVGALYV